MYTLKAIGEFRGAAMVDGIATVENNSSSVTLGNHAVLAVGAGVSNQRNYVKVRNAWGLGWGDDGYAWLSEEFLFENALEIFWLNKVESIRRVLGKFPYSTPGERTDTTPPDGKIMCCIGLEASHDIRVVV